jgi:hypothetical protein
LRLEIPRWRFSARSRLTPSCLRASSHDLADKAPDACGDAHGE